MSLADWTEGGAEFDVAPTFDVRPTYRHHLWRARPTGLISAGAERRLGICMHNPSMAGAVPTDNDPTVRKVIGFADRWGFSRIDVVNLSDVIATDPQELWWRLARGDAMHSSKGDDRIREVARGSDMFLVAWGALARPWMKARARIVLAELIARPVICIRRGNGGDPLHPSREAYTNAPLPYEARP